MKSKLILLLVISLLVVPMQPLQIKGEEDSINFKVKLLVNTNPIRIKEAKFIQSALLPLGIDVDIVVKNGDAWASSITRFSDSEEWDLIVGGWQSSSTTAQVEIEFYKSDWTLGNVTFDLGNKEWQQWQLSDTGIDQQDVDQMLVDMYFAPSVSEAKKVTLDFQQLFMEKLLYEIPLINSKSFIAINKGLEGININQGLFSSIALGAGWVNNPENRVSDNVTLVLPRNFPGLGIGQGLLEALGSAIGGRLVFVEDNLDVHPDIAIQWEISDWLLPNGSLIVNGKQTFKIREDANWANSYDFEYNNSTGPFPIRPEDCAYGYDYARSRDSVCQ